MARRYHSAMEIYNKLLQNTEESLNYFVNMVTESDVDSNDDRLTTAWIASSCLKYKFIDQFIFIMTGIKKKFPMLHAIHFGKIIDWIMDSSRAYLYLDFVKALIELGAEEYSAALTQVNIVDLLNMGVSVKAFPENRTRILIKHREQRKESVKKIMIKKTILPIDVINLVSGYICYKSTI